jgi:tetratricopeptide (TPR) repeat protein
MVDPVQLRDLQAKVEQAPPPEALAAARQLIEILTPLAQEAPARYLTQLATAWQDYGTLAGAVEGPAAGLQPLATALRMFDEVANDTDPLSLLRLIQCQQALADEHLALEQIDPAYQLLQEALRRGQGLAQLEPEAAQLVDARTFQLLSLAHYLRGDFPGAAAHGREAETRYRNTVRKQPEALPNYAAALRTLALSLSHEHASDAERKEAQKKIEEAALHYRNLAKHAPQLFQGEYAQTAFHHATILMGRGKRLQAAGAYENATDLYGKAVQHDPGLAESYQNAAKVTVDVYELMGNPGRARKLRQRYGLAG